MTSTFGAAGCDADCGAGAAAPPSSSNTIMSTPVLTLSPTLTMIDFTIPACGAGISIEALSPSTVMMLSSTATLSPTFTKISVTSTSSLPISGNLISILILFTSYAIRGLSLSALISNFLIASSTTLASMSPRLASSPNAAMTT